MYKNNCVLFGLISKFFKKNELWKKNKIHKIGTNFACIFLRSLKIQTFKSTIKFFIDSHKGFFST